MPKGGQVSTLRMIWNFVLDRDLRENADRTITTRDGKRVTPYRVEVNPNGVARTNIAEFHSQPRMRELREQMKPLLTSPPGDRILFDKKTGAFFLKSDLDRQGREKVTILGTADPDVEEKLVRHAATVTGMNKMFGDASPANPIVVEPDGTVHAQNSTDVRGKVNFGPEVRPPEGR
jgi:hypothetical protein